MSSHITEERSANLIDWSPIVITGNTMRCGPWEIYEFPRGSGPSDTVLRGRHFGGRTRKKSDRRRVSVSAGANMRKAQLIGHFLRTDLSSVGTVHLGR